MTTKASDGGIDAGLGLSLRILVLQVHSGGGTKQNA